MLGNFVQIVDVFLLPTILKIHLRFLEAAFSLHSPRLVSERRLCISLHISSVSDPDFIFLLKLSWGTFFCRFQIPVQSLLAIFNVL